MPQKIDKAFQLYFVNFINLFIFFELYTFFICRAWYNGS